MRHNLYLPHIYRTFTAVVTFLSITLIIVNIFHRQILGEGEEKRLQQEIVKSPGNSLFHEKLAQYYLSSNAKAAQREYALAEEFYQYSPSVSLNIAGAKSSPWQTWLTLVSFQQKLHQEVQYWESVHARLPDYQYANLKLAVLHYQLRERDKSNQYLQNFLHEDPTNSVALLLLAKLR